MMKVFWRFWVIGLGCGLFASSALAQNATIEIKAVKKNPKCVGGTRNGVDCNLPGDCPGGGTCGPDLVPSVSSLAVAPGDRVVAEVFARDWSSAGDLLRAYQLVFSNSFTASIRGNVAVLETPRFCVNNSGCAELQATCVLGVCTPADPRAGAVTINASRFDYAFVGLSGLTALDISNPDQVRFGGIVFNSSEAIAYLGSPVYLATIAFRVGAEMCGNVTIRLLPVPDSALLDPFERPIAGLEFSELILIGPDALHCGCRNIVGSDPPDCAIDARQPSNPDGTGVVTINSVRVKFDCPDAGSTTSADNWEVREVRTGFAPFVNSVVVDPADRSWVTVNFSRALTKKKWTCTTYTVTNAETCLGILAADVDQDSLSKKETDLAALVTCMKQPDTCTLRECDTDRTGACTPADLLRVADILNGGGSYAPAGDQTGILDINSLPIACP